MSENLISWRLLIEEFTVYLRLGRGVSENTVEAYQRDTFRLAEFITLHYPKLNPLDLKPEHITHFIDVLHEIGIADTSQARLIAGLKAFYNFLESKDDKTQNPMAYFTYPKTTRQLPAVLSPEEMKKLLSQKSILKYESMRNYTIIILLYYTGLRVSELINIKFKDINTEEMVLKAWGKGNKERYIPLKDIVLEQLEDYQLLRKAIKAKAKNDNYLFLSRLGKKMSRVAVFNVVKKQVLEAGLHKNISPHTFRHSLATHLLENGTNLRIIQQLLGHSNIQTTEIYTHIDISHLRKVINECHPLA